MKIISQLIDRPVLTSAIWILMVLAGICAFFVTPLRLFPKTEFPIITIDTEYSGANQDLMQGHVTSVIENALSGIPDLDYLTSSTTQGKSHIDIHLSIDGNASQALTTVISKVAAIRNLLPKNCDEPMINTTNSDDTPVMMLAFTSDTQSREILADNLRRTIAPSLETIDGVAHATVLGGSLAMRIWLDPLKMIAYNLTATDLQNALKQQQLLSTPGSINGKSLNYDLTLDSDLQSAEQFANIILKHDDNNLVKMQDIARIELGALNNKVNAIYNGKPGIMVRIETLPAANQLTVAKSIHEIIPHLQSLLPTANLQIAFDASDYIHDSIGEVVKSILEGILIVSLIVFLMLGSIRTALIPIMVIPISLISTFTFMLLFKYSTNLLTLLAMVIAVGLVVDDAIIVVENIHRKIESGLVSIQAAALGTSEIVNPIIAITGTLAFVYAPLAFIGGITGQLFSEFAFTLVTTLILSGMIALSLTPMMSAFLLKTTYKANFTKSVTQKINAATTWITDHYITWLKLLIPHRNYGLFLIAAIICANIALYFHLPKELEPYEDQCFLQVIGRASTASSTAFLTKNTAQLIKIFATIPEIDNYIYINGAPSDHQYLAFLSLKDWQTRSRDSKDLQLLLQKQINREILDLQSIVVLPSALPGESGSEVEFVLRSPTSYPNLWQTSQTLLNAARESGLFLYLKSDLNYDQPILNLKIDRNLTAASAASVEKISETLSTLINNNRVQQYSMNGHSYNVITQVEDRFRLAPEMLHTLYIKSDDNQPIPLANLIALNTTIAPSALNQFQKLHAVTLLGEMANGQSLAKGLQFLEAQTKKIAPRNVLVDFAGKSRQFIQEGNRMFIVFASAIVVIFLALAMQFESYRDPLIILFGSIPTSIFGALCCLSLSSQSLNIYTEIGLLTLIGLISKHGILLTNLANTVKYQTQQSPTEAIIVAAKLRLRPILMTTVAMLCGATPLILATGASSRSRFTLGIVIIAGVLVGSLCTLFIVPLLYSLLSKKNGIVHANSTSKPDHKQPALPYSNY